VPIELEVGLRWMMSAFFVVIGLGILITRGRAGSDAALVRTAGLDEPTALRLKSAIARRERMEDEPGGAIPPLLGVCALGAAALALFTRVDLAVIYAVFCAVLAGASTTYYLRLRSAGTKRAASLRPRTRNAVLPPWLWGSVVLCVVSPLAFADVMPFAAILVTVAAATVAVAGDRVARLPALMSGEDAPIEEYLDRRLRTLRAANVVTTAPFPAYFFDWWAAVGHDFTGLHVVALSVAIATQLIVTGWNLVVVFRPVQVAGAGPEAGRKRT
jgi:hypothetical protein